MTTIGRIVKMKFESWTEEGWYLRLSIMNRVKGTRRSTMFFRWYVVTKEKILSVSTRHRRQNENLILSKMQLT